MSSSFVVSIDSVTYLSTPFTILTQEKVLSWNRDGILNFDTVSIITIANFYVQDSTDSCILENPSSFSSLLFIAKHRLFSAQLLHQLSFFCIKSFEVLSFFEFPSLKGTGATKYWMIGIWEIQNHFFCHSIPGSVGFVGVGSVPFLLCARPPKKQWPRGNLRAWSATVCELYSQLSVFPYSLHAMSLYIDMKMILSVKCSGSHCRSLIRFLNLLEQAQRCDSWQYFPLEVRRHTEYHLILLFQVVIGSSPTLPTQSTESEKT